jgi:gluconolactonase
VTLNEPTNTPINVIVDDPSFEALIDPGAALVKIGDGYEFSEGPVWNQRQQALYFSDIPGDKRWRWTEAGGMELDAAPTFKGNGLAFDVDGSLLVCEQVSSCLTRIHADGRRELVAWHLDGVYLNSPNDVVVRSDGSIYFTDPDYGRWNDWIGCKREFVRDVKGVYRVPPGGGPVELVVEPHEFEQPNGLCFSPDESILYVNDSPRAEIKAFDVNPDGSLGPCRMFRDKIGAGTMAEGNLDGMECDALGNIWTSGPGGVWILNPAGERIGAITTPEICGSVVFGGRDLTTLFLTTTTTVHLMETKVQGAPLPGPT